MKKYFQNTGAFIMAFLVLLSTMSFTVEKHFCGNIFVDKAIFSEAETCGMETSSGHSDEPCCTNEKIAIDGQKELKASFSSLDLQQQVFITTFTYTYFNLSEGLSQQVIPFKDYSPPILVTDIQVLDQVFLI